MVYTFISNYSKYFTYVSTFVVVIVRYLVNVVGLTQRLPSSIIRHKTQTKRINRIMKSTK